MRATAAALGRTDPVQRRASNTGAIMIAGQKVALDRMHKRRQMRWWAV